jgi:hypothetical protein
MPWRRALSLALTLLGSPTPMRSLLLPLLLLPSLAAAQTTTPTLTLGFPANSTLPFVDSVLTAGPGECGEDVILTWSVSRDLCQPLSLYLVDSATACTAEIVPVSGVFRRNVPAADVNSAPPSGDANSLHAGTVTFTVADIFNSVPPAGATATTACGSADPQTRRFRVCGLSKVNDGLGCNVDFQSTPDDLEVVYDTEKPPAPTVTVSAQDEKLVVQIREDDDIDSRRVQIRLQSEPDTAFRDAGTRLSVGQFEISPLTNGTIYVVRAFQTDLAGNESDPSASIEATPMEVADFFERYQAAGGSETGGCGVAGGMGLTAGAALAVLGLWLAASRRRAS